jgi:ABC-type glycerol-3-phosphate transport system permease component
MQQDMSNITRAPAAPEVRQPGAAGVRVKSLSRRRSLVPHLILILLVVVSIYPLIFTLFASLKSNAQFYTSFWVPTAPFHWENYAEAWKALSGGFVNSVIVSAITVVGVVFMSALSAWTFARYEFPGKEIAYYAILALLMIPFFLTMIPLFWIVKTMRLTGSLGAVFLPYLAGQAFAIFLMRSFFENLPQEIFDSARVDGANEFTVFIRIGLPLCLPIVVTVAILNIMGTWNDFFWPLLAVGLNQAAQTVMVRTFNLTGTVPEYGLQTAGYVLVSLPMIVMFLLGMRYYIGGLTSGAIKI